MMKLFSKQRTHTAVRQLSKFTSKKTLLVLLFISLAAGLSAFPGIESMFSTESGQYVYYRDYTFPEETYIGFLQYDEGTYAIRYFTPYATNGQLPIIEMYLTLNPDVDYVDLTGEKIASPITQNDTEVMNYMHDLLYEFGARRKKLNDADFKQTVYSQEDYMQFGGNVTMQWDFFIPIFNLRSITDENGDILFEAVTTGTLSSSYDQSFSAFTGLTYVPLIDDYYIARIRESANKDAPLPEIIPEEENFFYVGQTGFLGKEASPPDYSMYSEEEREDIERYFNEVGWISLYTRAYYMFSQLTVHYLPYAELNISGCDMYLRFVCSEDGLDFSNPYYMINKTRIDGPGYYNSQLMIRVEDYWSNPEFYESLLDFD